MTAGFVKGIDVWPPAGPFDLSMRTSDGEPLFIVNDDGAEIDIFGEPGRDHERLVIPIQFATIDQARRAATVLEEAFAKVRDIDAETRDPCDEHETELFFLAREIVRHRICVNCNERLGTIKPGDPEWRAH